MAMHFAQLERHKKRYPVSAYRLLFISLSIICLLCFGSAVGQAQGNDSQASLVITVPVNLRNLNPDISAVFITCKVADGPFPDQPTLRYDWPDPPCEGSIMGEGYASLRVDNDHSISQDCEVNITPAVNANLRNATHYMVFFKLTIPTRNGVDHRSFSASDANWKTFPRTPLVYYLTGPIHPSP